MDIESSFLATQSTNIPAEDPEQLAGHKGSNHLQQSWLGMSPAGDCSEKSLHIRYTLCGWVYL